MTTDSFSSLLWKVCWLKVGDEAHTVLVNHLSCNRRLGTLKLLNHGMHTGRLENLHSLILAYAPKRLDFDPLGYRTRVKMAIIDHNCNVDRDVVRGM